MISKNLTPVNEFADTFRQQIYSELREVAASGHRPLIAAFDADGTLWDTDSTLR